MATTSTEASDSSARPLGFGVDCGGPLVCRRCAMMWAHRYSESGKTVWEETYRAHGRKLFKEHCARIAVDYKCEIEDALKLRNLRSVMDVHP